MCYLDIPMSKRVPKDQGIMCKRCNMGSMHYKQKGKHVGAYCRNCNRLVKWIDQRYLKPLTDDSPCPVKGEHFGVKMYHLDATFLDWLSDQKWLEAKYPKVFDYIKNNRHVIDLELEESENA